MFHTFLSFPSLNGQESSWPIRSAKTCLIEFLASHCWSLPLLGGWFSACTIWFDYTKNLEKTPPACEDCSWFQMSKVQAAKCRLRCIHVLARLQETAAGKAKTAKKPNTQSFSQKQDTPTLLLCFALWRKTINNSLLQESKKEANRQDPNTWTPRQKFTIGNSILSTSVWIHVVIHEHTYQYMQSQTWHMYVNIYIYVHTYYICMLV